MSKKTAIIFILVVFLGALGALIWFYFSLNANPEKGRSLPIATTTTDVYDPFGTVATDNNISTSTINTDIATSTSVIPDTLDRLRQISANPISGFSVTDNAKTGKTDIHYILRANGNIYEAYTDSPETKRLSITTVPKVYESIWLPGGEKLIIRYLKEDLGDVETFSVKINPATTTLNEFEGGIDGNHLPEKIGGLAVNPKGDKIFYLVNGATGSSGYVSKPDGLNKKSIFESPLIEWLISWPKEEIITITTKPSAKVAGYMYFLNSQTGSRTRVLGGINGLTTKTNSATNEVLYSDSTKGSPKLSLFNTKNGESKQLPWNTFPEKCLWSNLDTKIIYCAVPKVFEAGDYPDLWYQGLTSFTDDIWTINTDTGASTLVYDLEQESNKSMDIVDLQLDKSEDYLFFINKTDLTFWSLGLK